MKVRKADTEICGYGEPLGESVMIGHSRHSFSHQAWRSDIKARMNKRTKNPTVHFYCSRLLKQTPILSLQRQLWKKHVPKPKRQLCLQWKPNYKLLRVFLVKNTHFMFLHVGVWRPVGIEWVLFHMSVKHGGGQLKTLGGKCRCQCEGKRAL